MNDSALWLSKGNKIEKYDFNGNKIGTLAQVVNNYYSTIKIIDSLLLINDRYRSTLLNLNKSNINNVFTVFNSNYAIIDFVSIKKYDIFTQNPNENSNLRYYNILIDTVKFNQRDYNLSPYRNIGNFILSQSNTANSICKFNDSLMFILSKNIKLININNANNGLINLQTLEYDIRNAICKMITVGNQLFISIDNKIYTFTFNINANNLTQNFIIQ